jgi:hypothetical protein
MATRAVRLNARPTSIDKETLRFSGTLSTGAGVVRRTKDTGTNYLEVIPVAAVDLSRMVNAPIRVDHKDGITAHAGIVERAWIEGSGDTARVDFEGRLTTADDMEPMRQRVLDGTLVNFSAGYTVEDSAWNVGVALDGMMTLTATRWLPFEVSLVGVGADQGAFIRAFDEDAAVMEIDIVADTHALARAAAASATPSDQIVDGLGADQAASEAAARAAAETSAQSQDALVAAQADAAAQAVGVDTGASADAVAGDEAAADVVSAALDVPVVEPAAAVVEAPKDADAANLQAADVVVNPPIIGQRAAELSNVAASEMAVAALKRGLGDLIPEFLTRGFSAEQVGVRAEEIIEIRASAAKAEALFGSVAKELVDTLVRSFATPEQAIASYFRAAVTASPAVGGGSVPQHTTASQGTDAVKKGWLRGRSR